MADYTAIKYNVPFSKAGNLKLIKTLTSDGSDDDLSFVDGTSDVVLDSTYKEYLFIFNSIHPETDAVTFGFQGNAAGGSGYNETITSTLFVAAISEEDSYEGLSYQTAQDQAQGTGFQTLANKVGNDNDQCCSGYLRLFNPSSTTFVKHFMGECNTYMTDTLQFTQVHHVAGYFNTTSAIDEIQFKMSSDEIQGGTIQLFGVL
jgi:hypothetical protein